jgi:CBS domain-containing protein
MLVRERMTSPAVTITPETPFQEALKLMRDQKFRRLPVVDSAGKIVGIVSERDHAARVALASHLIERLGGELPAVEAEGQRHHDAQCADHRPGVAARGRGQLDGDAQDRRRARGGQPQSGRRRDHRDRHLPGLRGDVGRRRARAAADGAGARRVSGTLGETSRQAIAEQGGNDPERRLAGSRDRWQPAK